MGGAKSVLNFYALTSDVTRRRPLSFCVLIFILFIFFLTSLGFDCSTLSRALSPLHSILHINWASDFVLLRSNVNTRSLAIVILIDDLGRGDAEEAEMFEQYLCSITFEASMSISLSRAFWCDYHNWKSSIVKQKLCLIAFEGVSFEVQAILNIFWGIKIWKITSNRKNLKLTTEKIFFWGKRRHHLFNLENFEVYWININKILNNCCQKDS